MDEFFHAVRVFFDHLAAVSWAALGIALALHFAKVAVRTIAWRNILRAAYPQTRVPLRPIFGAYVAGVGVNSIVPGRGGDLVKLYLVRQKISGTTYTTLASTLFTETLVDLVLAGVIFIWALTQGVLPGLNVLPNLPTFDWGWLLRHGRLTATLVALLGHEVVASPFSGEFVRFRVGYDRDQIDRALESDTVFWLHPVARHYGDGLRRYIRERHDHYQ